MKKLTAFILTMLIALSMCACDGGKSKEPASTGSDLSAEEIERLADEALAKEAEAAAAAAEQN